MKPNTRHRIRGHGFSVTLALLLSLPLSASALCALVCSCSTSTTSVAFGTYASLSGNARDGTGNVRVTCGGVLGLTVPYTVALGTGANSSQFNPRKMASGAQRLNYSLYTDTSRTLVWGDGTAGSNTMPGSVSIVLLGGTSQDTPVYGRIPAGQTTVAPGNYSDSVVVTVTYN